jgi:tetratricopeptide (TPR) repeat protein
MGILLTSFFSLGTTAKAEDWNVLLISIDTIRPDRLSCYSSEFLKTPQIEALASRGFVFDRAFAHNPTTLPSHANILLGTTPLHHGVRDNSKFKVADRFLTLAEYLKQKGYATGAFIGAFPLDSQFGLSQGFDVYDESYPSGAVSAFSAPERRAEEVIDAAIDWISGQRTRWFSFVHLWDPHTLYLPPEPFLSKFKDDPYSGEVAYVDAELGRLFDYIETRDLFQNTLIVLTGDHGESLGEHGELTHSYFAYNSTLWVPLIFVVPNMKSGRIKDNVSHVDIFPTVCDLLGLDNPPQLQGTSVAPLLKGKKIKEMTIYFESLDPYLNRGAAPLHGFVQGSEKFMDSPIPEFYDLEEDFNEEKNLIHKIDPEKYRKKLKDLMDQFSSTSTETTPSQLDEEALEKLRSLGYVSSSAYSKPKRSYGPQDDLKTLLPFQKKLDRAVVLFDSGQVEESIQLINEIIQEKKDFARAYSYLFPIYRSQGKRQKALELMEEGYKNSPDNYEIVSAFGALLIDAGDLDRGIRVLQHGLALIDFDPKAWDLLGTAYWMKGDEQKALEHFEKALLVDDTFALAYSNIGKLYFEKFFRTKERKYYAQAMEYFKKAIERDPNIAMAYKYLGQGYMISGQMDAAISLWEKALELHPTDSILVLDLGKAFLEKGNKSDALKHFEFYLQLRKDSLSPDERREIDTLIQKCRQK